MREEDDRDGENREVRGGAVRQGRKMTGGWRSWRRRWRWRGWRRGGPEAVAAA